MKLVIILLLLTVYVYLNSGACIPKECDDTNYENYVKCLRRFKKSTRSSEENCENDTSQENSCQDCPNCDCTLCIKVGNCQKKTNRCRKVCQEICQKSGKNNCKTKCQKKCQNPDNPDISSKEDSGEITIVEEKHYNVTTLVNLNNDIQINITNQAYNCCNVVLPPTTTNEGPQTVPTCGDVCKKNTTVIHVVRNNCSDSVQKPDKDCPPHVYIPQPQPNCYHSPIWPYVTCRRLSTPIICYGCYGWYDQYYMQNNCHQSCFDDGFDYGPMYRKGPIFQPSFSTVPFMCTNFGNCPSSSVRSKVDEVVAKYLDQILANMTKAIQYN